MVPWCLAAAGTRAALPAGSGGSARMLPHRRDRVSAAIYISRNRGTGVLAGRLAKPLVLVVHYCTCWFPAYVVLRGSENYALWRGDQIMPLLSQLP